MVIFEIFEKSKALALPFPENEIFKKQLKITVFGVKIYLIKRPFSSLFPKNGQKQ